MAQGDLIDNDLCGSHTTSQYELDYITGSYPSIASVPMSYRIEDNAADSLFSSWATIPTNYGHKTTAVFGGGGIKVSEESDIMIGNASLKEFMKNVNDRLCILTADLEKNEKFAALKIAYEHYKLMEQLCQETAKENN